MGVNDGNNNNNNNNNDGESPWESATNDQAFRETVAGDNKGRQQQSTGEISNENNTIPSSPAAAAAAAAAVTSVVRWELEEDNSNNRNGNDVSFLTSETMNTNTNNAATATATAATSTTTTTTTTNNNNNNNNVNSSRRRRREGIERSSSDCFSKLYFKHILHIWDIILTLFWMVFICYHLYYDKDNEPSRSTSMAILLVICCVLAVLNLLRGLLWLWTTLPSLSTICCCGCFFDNDNENNPSITVYKISTNLTLSIGIAYGITAGIGWFGPSNWLPWCDGLTSGVWCTVLPKNFMPIVLTVSSVIELLRWIFLQGRLSSLEITTSANQRRSPDYYNDEYERNDFNASSPSETSRHRPWWWNRRGGSGGDVSSNNNNNELHDPLLDSTSNNGDDAVVEGQPAWTTMSSWIPFSPSRQRQHRNNTDTNNAGTNTGENNTNNRSTTILNGDEDDVESVLDSLGEDWATRTEDDPNWWTR
jgi:hypothetical protein